MKKNILIIFLLAVSSLFGLLYYFQYQQFQKEVIRSRFLEIKSTIDFLFLGNNLHIKDNTLTSELFSKLNDSDYSNNIQDNFKYFTPLFIIGTSPDYKKILETGLYLEGGPIGGGGHYNIEKLTDNIDVFTYNYTIKDIKVKLGNSYDVCILGVFAYSTKDNINNERSILINGPYKIDICYPVILKKDTIVIDSGELEKRLDKK